jgi:hypothetical protein
VLRLAREADHDTGAGDLRVTAVAEHAARTLGCAVVVALPGLGIAVSAPDRADPRAAGVSRHVLEPRARRPEAVTELVPVRGDRGSLGAVALLGPSGHSPEATRDVLELAALAVRAALDPHAAPADGAALLFRDLRAPRPRSAPEVLAMVRAGGADLAAGAVFICAATRFGPTAARSIVLQDAPGALVDVRGERLDALVPAGMLAARRIAARLGARGAVGLSREERDPGRLHVALREAEIVLALTRGGKLELAAARKGAWRLLARTAALDPAEVEELAGDVLGRLLGPEPGNVRLLDTLQTYLDTGGNMNATARAGYTHRHTVAYRLERVHELTGHDPRRLPGRELLSLGLKARAVRDAARAA